MKILNPERFFADEHLQFDLVINSDSLTELGRDVATRYFRRAAERSPVLFSVNHEVNPFRVIDLHHELCVFDSVDRVLTGCETGTSKRFSLKIAARWDRREVESVMRDGFSGPFAATLGQVLARSTRRAAMVRLPGHAAGNGGYGQGDTCGRGWSSPTRRLRTIYEFLLQPGLGLFQLPVVHEHTVLWNSREPWSMGWERSSAGRSSALPARKVYGDRRSKWCVRNKNPIVGEPFGTTVGAVPNIDRADL